MRETNLRHSKAKDISLGLKYAPFFLVLGGKIESLLSVKQSKNGNP